MPSAVKPSQPKKALTIREPGGLRGEVPACGSGEVDVSYLAYLTKLEPRADSDRGRALRHALALSRDPRFVEFLRRLSAPRYSRWRLETIAKSCEISLPQFAEFWKSAQQMRALAIAQDGAVEVMDDLVEDAKRQRGICDRCDGYGFVKVEADDPFREIDESRPDAMPTRECPKCLGKGMLLKEGSSEARKLLFETAGLSGKRAPMVQINQSFGGASIESAVDRLNRINFDVDADAAQAASQGSGSAKRTPDPPQAIDAEYTQVPAEAPIDSPIDSLVSESEERQDRP